MSTSSAPPPEDERLESWKQIAGYLQRDIRTVQRWEKQEGLPVHRHMHGERGTVCAYKPELQVWSATRSHLLDEKGWQLQHALAGRPFAYLALGLITLLMGGGLVWRIIQSGRALPKPVTEGPRRLFARATSQGGRIIRIPVGSIISQLLITPDGSELIAIHSQDRAISFFNARSEKLIHRMTLPAQPQAAAILPGGRQLYVGTLEGELYLIDMAARSIKRSIPAGGAAPDMAITPDGGKLFLAMGYAGLKRLTIATGELTTLPGLVCPVHVTLGPGGTRLYVTYQCGGPGGRSGHDAIDIVDTTSEASIGIISGPPMVGGALAVSPDGAQIWADGRDACIVPGYDHEGCPLVPGRVVHVFRASDRAVIQSIGLAPPDATAAIVFLPGVRRVAVLGIPIHVIDTAGSVPVETLDLGPVTALVPTPDGRRIYLALWAEKAIARLDLAAAQCEPEPGGLAHFWPGDGNANDARDGMHGVLNGGASFAPGRVGRGFSFRGAGFVTFGKHPPPALSDVEGTLAGWVWFEGSGSQIILERASREFDNGWRLLRASDGRLIFCLGSSQGAAGCRAGSPVAVASNTKTQPGVWHHVAVVKRGGTLAIYVNGVLEATTTLAAFLADSSLRSELRMGSSNPGAALHWMADEVMFYQRALGPEEIKRLFAVPQGEGCAPTAD